jgi:prophage regulatory protein
MQQPSALPLKAQDQASSVFLRMPSVMQMTGLGRSTIYRLMAQQQFPCPVRLGVRAVAWRRSELNEWSQTRPAASHWANTTQPGQLSQPTSVWQVLMTTPR